MRKFLIESSVFLVLISISFYLVFLKANGNTDSYYLRFTTPRQTSLILGTSKAAQGIMPSVLNKLLERNDLFNFSFTIDHSPYGPAYLESIKRKLKPDAKNGIYILTVDSWSISTTANNPEDFRQFEELKLFLGKINFVNLYPNIPYLLNQYDKQFFNLLLPSKSNNLLHDDGWLEVNVGMDSVSFNKRFEKRVVIKKDKLKSYKFSQVRLDYLVKTIEYLKTHGNVYMVRLPVHPRLMELDDELLPDFNNRMMQISERTHTPYFDMSFLNDHLLYTDGNHLAKESSEEVSKIIGNWINGFN